VALEEPSARRRPANGEYHSTLVRAAPFCHAKGKIIKWFGSSSDIEDLYRETMMDLVAMGRDVSLTSEATLATIFPDMVFRQSPVLTRCFNSAPFGGRATTIRRCVAS
jgi:hypothetical protein